MDCTIKPATTGTIIKPPLKHSLLEEKTDPTWQDFKDTVSSSIEEGKMVGKKLGVFSAAVAGSTAIPIYTAVTVPPLTGVILGPVGVYTSLSLMALEEKFLGIGKRLGAITGAAIGAGIGVAKGTFNEIFDITPHDGNKKVELSKALPKGKRPWEPLFPAMLHRVEQAVLGGIPERTQAIERGENIASFAATAAAAAVLPSLAVTMVGGPVATILGTMVGSLLGLVAGSFEENTLGVGRAVGEATGTVISAVNQGIKKITGWQDKPMVETVEKKESPPPSGKSSIPTTIKSIPGKILGLAGKAFMALNAVISEPLISFIIDSSSICNKALQEKPVETIAFKDRPFPEVNKERLINNFIGLAGINATYKKEEAVVRALAKQFKALKIDYDIDKKGNVIASIPPSKGQEDSPTILLSAHMDTVAATSPEAIINDGKRIKTNERYILGADDRAGIAEIMEGVQTVMEKGLPHPEIKIVFTVGEEVGLKGSSSIKPEDVSSRPTLGYVVDATDKRNLYLANDAVLITWNSLKYNFSQEDPLIQVAMRSMADGGIRPRPIHGPILAGAGTDANTPAFNNNKTRSVAIGTGANEVHTPLENVKICDIEQIARTVVGLLTNSCDLKVNEEGNIVPRYILTLESSES